MAELTEINGSSIMERNENELVERTSGMLAGLSDEVALKSTLSMPVAQLVTLGAGVSSLLPALNTVTQTTTFNLEGLYRVANASPGDVLKVAKDGNYWGAMVTDTGASKLVKLQDAGPLTASSQSVAAINPATMLMYGKEASNRKQ